jgi:hypothetical protein
MSRWHKPSYTNPNIVVNGDIPRCLACKASPSLQELIDNQRGPNALRPPPSDELGQLNLWWPRCVPYQRYSSHGIPDTKAPIRKNTQGRADIYSHSLDLDEFRLICLLAPANENNPVYVGLETYRHDNCPEYEAVSYT